MPSISIDTFFACTLIVSVAIIAMAYTAGTLYTQINSAEDLNKQAFLQGIADHLVLGAGTPTDWGSTGAKPSSLGFAGSSQVPFELDIDKVSRLSNNSAYSLEYIELLQAAKLSNVAIGASVSQMITVNVQLLNTADLENATEYTFSVQVSQDSGALGASLRGYVLVDDFLGNLSGSTEMSGLGSLSVEVPNSVNGSAVVVVFARASFDDRVTAYGVCQFVHVAGEVAPNHTYLQLSPLDNKLNVEPNVSGATAEGVYAFSYGLSWNITTTFSDGYAIPEYIEGSPVVVTVKGISGEVSFLEWVSYPSVPLEAGADFSRSEANVFTYTVTVRNVLYRLTLRFGDVVG